MTRATLESRCEPLDPDDVVIDGGNSYYQDDVAARARSSSELGLHYVDCGTSGGVWGLERGYCLMIGGENDVVARLDPLFARSRPARTAARARRPSRPARRRPGATCTADRAAPATSSRWCTTASSTG